MSRMRIALLCGGFSAEREISIKTGKKIAENLDKKKYQVFLFDPKTELDNFIKAARDKKFDLVFPALHGPFGEDGTLQGLLDILGVPYVFSGVLASSLAMDKERTKMFLRPEKILMPRSIKIKKNYLAGDLKKIKLPVVVKPICQGSSFGASIVKKEKDLLGAIEEAFKFDSAVMIEEFIEGREITAAVLGNDKPVALPLIEIKPKISSFFDFKAKYEVGASEEICPAALGGRLTKEIQAAAIKIHKLLGCRGVTRSDFIVKNGRPYFLEINTIPGMTETSLVPLAAKKSGLSFSDLLDELIALALGKK